MAADDLIFGQSPGRTWSARCQQPQPQTRLVRRRPRWCVDAFEGVAQSSRLETPDFCLTDPHEKNPPVWKSENEEDKN